MNSVESIKTLDIFIVCHNQQSLELFKENNKHIDISKFKFILVGNWEGVGEEFKEEHIVASFLPDNIERFEKLLTFTAWYALTRNNLIKSDYVGIFEYDCIFKDDIFKLKGELEKNCIIGFNPRVTNEHLYLNIIPEFCNLLSKGEIKKAKKNNYWNATTNMILPINFLEGFVSWYLEYVIKILKYTKVSHYHERAVNVLAANMDIDYKFFQSYVEHKQLMSHGISLQK